MATWHAKDSSCWSLVVCLFLSCDPLITFWILTMSEKEQPKKNKSDDEQSSDQSEEAPKDEFSPGEAEDRCLLSHPAPAGAEALPVASGSGASSTKESKKITGMLERYNPFKHKNPKKRKLSSSFSKAKDVFRRTFRKSDTQIQTSNPETEKKHPRKISDPTHYKTKVEPLTEIEPETKKTSLSASPSKDTKAKTEDESKSKEPKSKRFFSHFSGSSSKDTAAKPESEKEETKAVSEVQKTPLSPRASDQPSIGNVSVGFFNEGMLPSESSGVPTESTSIDTQDVKSGSSFSPDSSGKKPSTKRPRAKDDDNESSFSD